MTTVAIASIKGAPGVTTLSCLLAATWPDRDRVFVAECDPSGGDLAARFSLSSRHGWVTLAASIRRQGLGGSLAEHLQVIPGGLRILVGSREHEGTSPRLAQMFASDPLRFSDGPWDVIVDLGRLLPDSAGQAAWLQVADTILIVLRPDIASTLHINGYADGRLGGIRDQVQLVTMGPGYPVDEIERFVSLPVVAQLPWDTKVAQQLAGQRSASHHLRRSSLIGRAARLASLCAGRDCPADSCDITREMSQLVRETAADHGASIGPLQAVVDGQDGALGRAR